MARDDHDPYLLLGVSRQASRTEIGRAYRCAARATHPDGRPADPSAAERFRAVTVAYDILRDPDRRAAYDRAHPVVERVASPVAARAAPTPVRLGVRRRATADPGPGLTATSFERRAAFRARPVHVVLGRRSPSAPLPGTGDRSTLLAVLLSHLTDGAW